jgi:predicted Ser/Thr protein kinase
MVVSLPFLSRKLACDDADCSPKSGISGVSTPTSFFTQSIQGTTSPVSASSAWEFHETDALSALYSSYDVLSDFSRFLGSGASGSVWTARSRIDWREVAVKTVSRPAYTATFPSEIEILRSVQSVAGVVKLLDSFVDDEYEILVMELCDGMDLQRWNNCLTSIETRQVVRGLVSSLKEMHEAGVSHGDIRLENIMVSRSDTGDIKATLVDFGSGALGTAEACVDLHGLGQVVLDLLTGNRDCGSDASSLHVDNLSAFNLVELLMGATAESRIAVLEEAGRHSWLT